MNDGPSLRTRTLAAQLRISMRSTDLGGDNWSPLDVLTELAMGFDCRPEVRDANGEIIQPRTILPFNMIDLRLSAARELAAYVAPKLRAIEFTAGDQSEESERRMGLVNKLLETMAATKLTSLLPPPLPDEATPRGVEATLEPPRVDHIGIDPDGPTSGSNQVVPNTKQIDDEGDERGNNPR